MASVRPYGGVGGLSPTALLFILLSDIVVDSSRIRTSFRVCGILGFMSFNREQRLAAPVGLCS